MKKRLLVMLLLLCLLLTALPTGAFAVEGEETLPAVQAAEGGETKEKTPPDDRTDGEDGGQAPLVGAMTVTEFVTLDPDELDGFSDAELLEDYRGRSLLVFSSYWSIDYTRKRNPGLELSETAQ